MRVFWLEQVENDVPPTSDWLSAREATQLNALRFAKRRADWRLGRWTAKHAVASRLNLAVDPQAMAAIEIRPAPCGAPDVFVANAPAPVTISLSHRGGTALCAVASCGVELGCDLEIIEPRSEAFVADYFTAEERDLVACASTAERSRVVTLLWSAKESALKAMREGLRLDTRSVVVSLSLSDTSCDSSCWNTLQARSTDGSIFYGWWRNTNGVLRTLLANPSPDLPVPLKMPAYLPDRPCFDLIRGTAKTNQGCSMVP